MTIEDNMVVFEEIQVVENANNNDNLVPEIKRFNCKFCNQTFTTGQALGGHQNRHRVERNALMLASQPRTAEPLNPDHHPIIPPHLPYSPISSFVSMQPPLTFYSFNPHRLQPVLTFTQPRCVVHVNQACCSGHGVGSSSGGGGGNSDDNAMRLRLGGVDQAITPYVVNFHTVLRGTKYYEEEWENKDGDKLDLTLHL
ncbi:beta-beta-alpha zinc fingers domain-containing protein [Dioscorea alata]|uniref:Beta-beta-alpha zinc fingers domain-containing protein n=1 Tax=Dioscorea alata TaxID=55571 RepID=A0ACB7UI19_DIOAL|nr:beta-beta-alpha zinc fingers domain-containing protein [Dioscorea alata]